MSAGRGRSWRSCAMLTRGGPGLLCAMMAALSPACGGGGGRNGACGKVLPCGGEVVGSYDIREACLSDPSLVVNAVINAALDANFISDCPGRTVDDGRYTTTGTASFNADSSYAVTSTVWATATQTVPASSSCLMPPTGHTCAELDQRLRTAVAGAPDMFEAAQCMGDDACTCIVTLAAQSRTESGTYARSGTTLTTSAVTSQVTTYETCVQGNVLHLMQGLPATVDDEIMFDMVLERN